MKRLPIILALSLWLGFAAAHCAAQTTQATITYGSSIDAGLTALKADISYPTAASNLPIVVLMHGFSNGVANAFGTPEKQRWANYNVFAVMPEMRGRGGGSGTQDGGAREIWDIVDAVEYVKANHASKVDASQIYLVGWSGGGGNAMSCAAKFPDYFNGMVAFFGISDYGVWYNAGASGSHQSLMDTWIGGTPAAVPNNYAARRTVRAAANYRGGFFWFFHDFADTTVPVAQTTRLTDVFQQAGLSNYAVSVSASGDTDRWTHGNAEDVEDLRDAEAVFMPSFIAKRWPSWSVPASGTVEIAGYIDTKRFTVWLGDGKSEYGRMTYSITSRAYTITCETGGCSGTLKPKSGNVTANVTINGSSVAPSSGVYSFTIP